MIIKKLSYVGNILCIQQQTDEPDVDYLKICVPLSLFFKAFHLAHFVNCQVMWD